jgi:thiol-disulfide isomerase/thioredoxin
MLRSTLTFVLSVVAVAALRAQVDPAERDALARVFDRPPNTTVQQPQKDALAAWLARHEGKDLDDLGYAVALRHYFDRDYEKAVEALDAFAAKKLPIANEEHRTMCGRIFLNAAATEGRAEKPDMDKLARWAEGMARLYDDTAMLERMAKAIAPRAPDPAAFRTALARGVLSSAMTPAKQDAFLRALFGGDGGGAGAAVAARAPAEGRAGAAAAGPKPGDLVAPFAIERVAAGPKDFTLEHGKGKVVVLDFFASWCAPCRETVPHLVALQGKHRDDVCVVGVTRYHGRGMDFAAAGATTPHGGTVVKDLDREQEAALYRAFAERFGIDYPIVFPEQADLARDRFGVTAIPAVFVIGRDGRLVGKVVGGGDGKHEELLRLVEQARR